MTSWANKSWSVLTPSTQTNYFSSLCWNKQRDTNTSTSQNVLASRNRLYEVLHLSHKCANECLYYPSRVLSLCLKGEDILHLVTMHMQLKEFSSKSTNYQKKKKSDEFNGNVSRQQISKAWLLAAVEIIVHWQKQTCLKFCVMCGWGRCRTDSQVLQRWQVGKLCEEWNQFMSIYLGEAITISIINLT